ncbi:hypothetical protein IKO50_05130 [bacterium]|jgi:hypothetical protein|nr:hypothetical protein [bacterium]
MEWLNLISWIFVAIKWFFVIVFFLCAILLAFATLISELMARDEKKMFGGKDNSWKFFRLIAIVLGIFACILAWFGYLLL